MAEVKIVADKYVVCSTITLENYQKLKRYRPEALILRDEDKNEIFKVKFGSQGGVCKFGVVFDATTNDDNRFLTVTGCIPECYDNNLTKEYVIEAVRIALPQLKKIEDGISSTLEGIDAEIAAIEASITILI